MLTAAAIWQKIDQKTKPLGSLGQLEALAHQIATEQNTLTPELSNPHILVFAADHGAASAGISAFPSEVTAQMVMNFLSGGGAINVFARQHGVQVQVIDAGVNSHFPAQTPGLLHQKVAMGTQSYLEGDAMSDEQLERCLAYGAERIDALAAEGCNIVGLGEMGIGNTASASLIMHQCLRLPLAECVGRGTGLDDQGLARKLALLQQAAARHQDKTSPKAILAAVGGFEIAQMVGAMCQANARGLLILIDGFIATAALLIARELSPNLLARCIFCHQSDESGHALMLDALDAKPLLKLNLRLGEGSGCALAYPLVQSAVAFFNEMASFESAGVSESR